MHDADIVITCAASPHPVLRYKQVSEAMSRRPGLPLVILDIAMPRNVEPSVQEIPGVHLHNIDDLNDIAEGHRLERETEVQAVERIIAEEVAMLMKWWQSYNARPVIKSLMKKAEQIRAEQYSRSLRKLPGITEAERQAIDLLTRSIVDKILREPIMFLKSGEGTDGSEAISRLFGLDDGNVMKSRVIIGTRGSRLAVIQANLVASELQRAHPSIQIELCKIVTEGDRNRHISIDEAGDTGIFVKALEEALADERIDIAVHSLKDMPTVLPADMCLAAVTENVLAMRWSPCRRELKPGSLIGTGSLRRIAQLKNLRPDLQAINIRGNVDSRLRKVNSGELQGVIVAAAALIRLGWDDKITEYLPLESFLPAVGQGALAIEARKGDRVIEGYVAILNHTPTRQAVDAERAFLQAVEGGCRAPVAALATVHGQILKMSAMVANKAGTKIIKQSLEGDASLAEGLGVNCTNDAGSWRGLTDR
jgi:hydroxymethylbilane synthase